MLNRYCIAILKNFSFVNCYFCGKPIKAPKQGDELEGVEYVKFWSGKDVFFHTKCFYERGKTNGTGN